MGECKIKTSHVRAAAGEQRELAKQMKQLEDELRQIQNGLSFEIAQKQQIRQRLRNTGNTISSQSKELYDAAKVLDQIADIYETTEAQLAGYQVRKTMLEPLTNLSEIRDLIPSFHWNPSSVKPDEILGVVLPGFLKEISKKYLSNFKTSYGWNQNIEDKVADISYSKNKENIKDSTIGVIEKVLEKRWEKETSLYHAEGMVGDRKGSYGKSELDVFKQNSYAELYAGPYYVETESGEKKLRVAAGVSAGYTMTALSMTQEARLGNDYLNAYAGTEITLGRVEGSAEAVIGLHDAKGNFNPTAYVGLAGGATLAEVSGKAKANILGVGVGAEAKVSVGVEAHAKAGYKDGKLSVDVGASLGIGGSIKLEVDIGGAVNAVEGAARAVWTNFIKGF